MAFDFDGSSCSQNLKKHLQHNKEFVKSPTWFHNLPKHILAHIFKNLNEEELQKSVLAVNAQGSPNYLGNFFKIAILCKQVCQEWRYAAQNPFLWKCYKVVGSQTPTKYICWKLRNMPYLHTIYMDQILEPVEIIRQICRSNRSVKHLVLKNCPKIPEISMRHLIRSCNLLETLNIQNTPFKGNIFYVEIGGLRNLKSLNVCDNWYFTVNNLMAVVLNCHGLKELHASKLTAKHPFDSSRNKEDFSFLIPHMSPELRTLVLDTTHLTHSAFENILHYNKLEKLGLYGATNFSGELFSNLWKYLPKLRELRIRYAYVDGNHVHSLFTNGQHVMQYLKVLDFTGCWKINDIGLKAIAQNSPQLCNVNLKACRSLTDVSPLLDKCKRLEDLNIAFCFNIKSKCIESLPSTLVNLYIHDSENIHNILKHKKYHENKCIYICLSEYNNSTMRYY